jgi:hypothetical protein
MEYRHLLGPTAWAADFCSACRNQGIPLGLVLDMSHAAQWREDREEAWNKARPVCNHVHFANSILKKDSPLYGDKHPFFEVPDGVYTHKDAQNFYAKLQNEQIPITASLEIICPAGEEETTFFNRIVANHPWFFTVI